MAEKVDAIKTRFAEHFYECKVASFEGAGAGFDDDRATFLAKLLVTAGHRDEYSASLRVPPLNSYAKHPEEPKYIYLFDFPRGASAKKPVSLHDQISSKKPEDNLSLNDRFRVAKTIARSLGAFHSDGWLHKSIRSHAVKFFFAEGGVTPDPTNPYLTDFEFSRPEQMDTVNVDRPVQIEQDIYRHPDRFGPPTDRFRKIHDVYALGVVLLEIGLWRTAISLYDDYMDVETQKEDLTGDRIQEEFLKLAGERLGHQMGTSYKEAVVKCLDGSLGKLHGTDETDRDFATIFQREIVRKIEKSGPREAKSGAWDE
jgi:serine/threonine protein kinase